MKLATLKNHLSQSPSANVRFMLPDGSSIAPHAHVTEVARIDKRFMDCGGTMRTDSMCRLQTWVAGDLDHRLPAGKLLRILEKAGAFLLSDELEVDVEHEAGWISQFPIENIDAGPAEVVLQLGERHTACLAEKECKCKETPKTLPGINPLKLNFREEQTASKCCARN